MDCHHALVDLTIPDSVTHIGVCAFQSCSSLANVTIPDSVTHIGHFAFLGCNSLVHYSVNLTIPNSVSVTNIGDGAFCGCSSLVSLTIPNSVTHIGIGAFRNASCLSNLTIAKSMIHIEPCAFQSCSSLVSLTNPNSVTHIGNHAFDGCLCPANLTIPDSLMHIGRAAFGHFRVAQKTQRLRRHVCRFRMPDLSKVRGTVPASPGAFEGSEYSWCLNTAFAVLHKTQRSTFKHTPARRNGRRSEVFWSGRKRGSFMTARSLKLPTELQNLRSS